MLMSPEIMQQIEVINFKLEKRRYLPNYLSEKGFKFGFIWKINKIKGFKGILNLEVNLEAYLNRC